jgi:hypothetical protein
MRNERTPAEKAQIGLGVGFSGAFATRLLLRLTDDAWIESIAMVVGLATGVALCYGVAQLAVSKGRSPAWGFTGFFGFLLLRFVLKPLPQPDAWGTPMAPPVPPAPQYPRSMAPPPPPPGYVPS